MPTPEQKELWRKEKEQQLRDKETQEREIRRREIPLSFGGKKTNTAPQRKANKPTKLSSAPDLGPEIPDNILRQRLGLY